MKFCQWVVLLLSCGHEERKEDCSPDLGLEIVQLWSDLTTGSLRRHLIVHQITL